MSSSRRLAVVLRASALPVCTTLALAQSATTSLVSVSSSGAQGNLDSTFSSVTPDGRYVIFGSTATNLVVGDTNGKSDVFVRDRLLGTTERVSLTRSGAQANDDCTPGALSADGRFAVFSSSAANLVSGDTNGQSDLFVRDRSFGTTNRISTTSSGAEANGGSGAFALTPDFAYIAFVSNATNFVAFDTNGFADIFVKDTATGTVVRASVGLSATEPDQPCLAPAISADGRYVAFESGATNLVPADNNNTVDVFVRDLVLNTTERVNVSSAGAEANQFSGSPSISADGRYVAFYSRAGNLVAGDTNQSIDIFVRDRVAGTTQRVSVNSAGTQGFGDSTGPSISPEGRFVAFQSVAWNLAPNDNNGFYDVFVHDRFTSTTERISLDAAGGDADNVSGLPHVCAGDRYVVFESPATDLVAGDLNAKIDIFVREIPNLAIDSFCDAGVVPTLGCPCGNPPASAGRGCDNSSATGGATLFANGQPQLSGDTLVFLASAEKPTATSILLQGTLSVPGGLAFGQGVRCVGGALKRLYTKSAQGGTLQAPDLGAGDPSVSARSSALGDPIAAGTHRYYLVYYRDPVVLGGCAANLTFNATQSLDVLWQ